MSRSYWKTPISGVCRTSTSCKEWRAKENGRYRSYVRDEIHHQRYHMIQDYRGKFGNEWDSPRDGKSWFGHIKWRKCPYGKYWSIYRREWHTYCNNDDHLCYKYYAKLMRK
jgi:hypothetical protein